MSPIPSAGCSPPCRVLAKFFLVSLLKVAQLRFRRIVRPTISVYDADTCKLLLSQKAFAVVWEGVGDGIAYFGLGLSTVWGEVAGCE